MKKLGFVSLICIIILFMMACASKGKETGNEIDPNGIEDVVEDNVQPTTEPVKEDAKEEIKEYDRKLEEIKNDEIKNDEVNNEVIKKDPITNEEANVEANNKEKVEVKTEDVINDIASDKVIENVKENNEVKKDEKDMDNTEKKLIALTFDDGPNTTITPKILDILEANDAVATFFLIGQNINESTVKVMERQLELNCEIANHTWSHSNLTTLSAQQIQEEIQKTTDKINEAVGVTPAFFRPPFIATNAEVYQNIQLPFINGINCNDWTASVTAQQRAETILKNAKDGDIVLLHDFVGNNNTVAALEDIILGLRDKGFEFVTVSQLFEQKGVDPNVANKLWTNTGW